MKTRKNEYLTKGHGIDMTDLDQSIFIPQEQGTLLSPKELGVFILPRKKWENVRGVDMNSTWHSVTLMVFHCCDYLWNSDS